MPRRSYDTYAVDDALRAAERVMTHAALRELGVPPATISRRIGPEGRWQRLLPGVVLAHRGTPTRRELQLGALAYAGGGSLITGADALRAAGSRVRLEPRLLLLTPAKRQRASFGFVRIERTRRMPEQAPHAGLPFAPAARATIDACRHLESLTAVRELAASSIQQGLCSVDDLAQELRAAARQRTALVRKVFWEVSEGVRSVAEARAREIVIRLDMPQPLWNATLINDAGEAFLTPDGFWPEFCAALEIDSREWHFRPGEWKQTRARQRRLTIGGVPVISFSPMEIIEEPDDFAHDCQAFLRSVGRRSMPAGLSVRRAA